MDIETAGLFFALLAVVAQVLILGAILLAVGGRFVPAIARARDTALTVVGPQAAGLGLAVALVCTLGSLHLSEINDLPPCRLCWVQRGFMYPQIVLFGLALLLRRRRILDIAAVTVALGGAVSIYHMLIERFPDLENAGTCDLNNRCSIVWIERFGYLTIPTMALSGFALLFVLAMIGRAATPVPHPEDQ